MNRRTDTAGLKLNGKKFRKLSMGGMKETGGSANSFPKPKPYRKPLQDSVRTAGPSC